MSWLDKWVYGKVTLIEAEYLAGLRKSKILDCWCIALWQFTGVGISCAVVSAYFLCGINSQTNADGVNSQAHTVGLN